MTRTTVSQAALADKIQEVIDRVQRGEVVVVERGGKEQLAMLDPLDFRILTGLAKCAVERGRQEQEIADPDVKALRAYLDDEISLGKAAELLDLHRLQLQERFLRLGVPLRLGPATLEEAREEIRVARSLRRGENH